MEAMTALAWAMDVLLGLGLLWLAWRALASPDPFKAIVLFVAFGLIMALAWVRLAAPDVALAEAAIGAGMTGALLMAALARLQETDVADSHSSNAQPTHFTLSPRPGMPRESQKDRQSWRSDARMLSGRANMNWRRWLLLPLPWALAAGLGYTVLSLPERALGLQRAVADQLAQSGVSNPVTAVLLNFRGYDTLLEMVVLFLALLGVWALSAHPAVRAESAPGPVLDTLTRVLVPGLIMVTAYLLWAGAHAPGGAFQAGSVLGAAGVLLLLTGWRLSRRLAQRPLRVVLAAGVVAFLVVAALALLSGRQLLEYPPSQAGTLILCIEALATASIGVTLAALFLGTDPTELDIGSTDEGAR